jgi:DNA replication protein DnaC
LTKSNVPNVRRRRTCSIKIIASRNQKHSTALVTNVDFDKWGDCLADGPLAMAFFDRLVEGAIILKVKGKSYRAEKAKASENHSP